MAPVDRHERRQQRVRGAGPSAVQANFGFNLAAFAPKVKQAPAPPQSLRRTRTPTPSRKTPGSSKASAKSTRRHRSVSIPRSSSVRRSVTPRNRTVTPRTSNRKRGSQSAPLDGDDGELDELSPEHGIEFPSVEKSRRVAAAVSTIREEPDDAPDELSILDDSVGSARKSIRDPSVASGGTPGSVSRIPRSPVQDKPEKTPIAERVGNMSITMRKSLARRSKSSELQVTPKTLPNGGPRLSTASHFDESFNTPNGGPEDESEDELTPRPKENATPRSVVSVTTVDTAEQDNGEADELSSPSQPDKSPSQPLDRTEKLSRQTTVESPVQQPESAPTRKRGRPRKVVSGSEDDAQVIPAVGNQPAHHQSDLNNKIRADPDDNDVPDELSPANRTRDKPRTVPTIPERPQPTKKNNKPEPNQPIDIPSGSEDSDDFDPDDQPDEEEYGQRTRPTLPSKPTSQPSKAKPTSSPPRKRQKTVHEKDGNTAPKQTISVMRLKQPPSNKSRKIKPLPTVRGISAADITHALLTQTIDTRISRLAAKLNSLSSSSSSSEILSSHKKTLRTQINTALSYTETLAEKFLDLRDANDVLSTLVSRRKALRTQNASLRSDFLGLQNQREEIALQVDDVSLEFESRKEEGERKDGISKRLWDIQGAIRLGKEKAREEGREGEGARWDLGMWVRDLVAGGGLVGGDEDGGVGILERLKKFNGGLERAAGWLENSGAGDGQRV